MRWTAQVFHNGCGVRFATNTRLPITTQACLLALPGLKMATGDGPMLLNGSAPADLRLKFPPHHMLLRLCGQACAGQGSAPCELQHYANGGWVQLALPSSADSMTGKYEQNIIHLQA